MNQLISNLEQVTPAWLTGTLTRNGFPGQVAGVRAASTPAFTANITRLELSYAAGAAPSFGEREVQFHQLGARVGAGDLARFIALNWYPERRRALERGLVRRYHDGLLQRGVQGYGWDDCWRDYRLDVIDNLSMPVWMWSGGKIGPEVWWDKLEKTVLAVEDLGCAELL
jgi:hypothetical protein